jgi:hypothetical protein
MQWVVVVDIGSKHQAAAGDRRAGEAGTADKGRPTAFLAAARPGRCVYKYKALPGQRQASHSRMRAYGVSAPLTRPAPIPWLRLRGRGLGCPINTGY